MNAKIERVQRDIDKTKGKIADLQASLRELERRKLELENTEIVDIVRGLDISLLDLAAVLKAAREAAPATSGQVGPKSGPGPGAEPETEQPTMNEDKEDSDE